MRLSMSILLLVLLCHSSFAYTVFTCKVEIEKFSYTNEATGTIWIPKDRQGLYLRNQYCRWYITAPFPNQTITVRIDEYDLEMHKSCNYDYVIAYDGTDECSEPLSEHICGKGRNISLTSKGSKVMIVFSSDGVDQRKAFNIDFTINDVANNQPASISGNHNNHQKNYNYQGSIFAKGGYSCNRTITTNFSERVFINILDFTNSPCSRQALLVYERFGTIWHYADQLCGMDSFQSNASAVMIKLQSQTLIIKIHFYVIAQNVSSGRPVTHRNGNATLSIPNGVPYMVTKSYEIHAWHMIAPLGNIVSLKWTLLNYGNESGFILVKEGPTAAAPTVYSEISHENGMRDEFAHLVWIQADLDRIAENPKQLAKNGTFIAHYFEVLFILGVKTSHKFRFWINYETVPLITNPEFASYCFYRVSGIRYGRKCLASVGPHLLKPDETAEVVVSKTYNHYTKWTFLMDDGKFAKLSFFDTGRYSRLGNCMYTGLGLQEIFRNGSVGQIMGPFCSRPYGEVIIPYKHFSIIVYQRQIAKVIYSRIITKIVVSISHCRGLFISNIPLTQYTDISNFECIWIQEIIAESGNDISSMLVSSKNMNTYLAEAGGLISSGCKKSTPVVSKLYSNNSIDFSIQYNHSCNANAFPSYIELNNSPKTDCEIITDLDRNTINLKNNSFCGFVRLYQVYDVRSQPVVFILSYNQSKAPSLRIGRHYYNLFFHTLLVSRGALIIEETVSPRLEPFSTNPLLFYAGVVQKYDEFTDVKMTDFEINSLRTEMIRLTFTNYMLRSSSIIMDYQLRTYNPISDHRQRLCTSGFVQYEDNCYMFVNMTTEKPRTWHQGESECSKHNATLLSITSKDEMDAMRQLLAEKWAHFIFSKKIFMIYIGLQDKEKVNIELMNILKCCDTYLKETNQSIKFFS